MTAMTGQQAGVQRPTPEFTLALLQELEWKRFEQVTEVYFQQMGWDTHAAPIGPDGGVDIHLTRPGSQRTDAVVQCKAWLGSKVGVSLMRELFGVMADATVPEGFFVTTSEYSSEARAFAAGKRLTLIDGADFVRRIEELPRETQARLYATATADDYRTPTCPSCGLKMVKKTSGKGRDIGKPFWGCPAFPRCRATIWMRTDTALE
jgi:restriction system protein